MDLPKQKVNIAPSTQPWWSFPVTIHQEADGTHVKVEWPRLGLMLLVFAVGAWLTTAGGMFVWVKYFRGFDEARIVDILLPNRWTDYRTARGNFYIKQAKREISEQKWVEAIHHLRVGVAAAPSNTEGRLVLAQFFTLFGRIELAQRTLVDGLPYARENTEYLKSLFGFLLQYQEDDEVRRLAADLLPSAPVLNDRNQLVALAAATAHFYRGNYEAAETLIKDYALLRTKDGRLLVVRIEWERGHRDRALELLRSYTTEFPDDEEFYNQLASYHRELRQYAAVEKFALLRELANPRSAAARIDLLQAYRLNNNTSQYQRGIDSLLRDFPEDRTALLSLANFGTENGDAALALRVYRHLQDKSMETDAAGLMVAEAHIVAREYRAALDFILELGRSRPEWLQKFLGVVNGLQAVACYGLEQREDGDLYLTHFLGQPNIRAEHLTAISNRLIAIGARAQARRVLAQAVATDLRNQTALTRLIELDLERAPTDELIANLRRLLTMRRPSPELLQTARARLSSDRFLFVAGRDDLLGAIQAVIEHGPAPVEKSS
jgi:Tfp pilus assembly protein PilF